VFEGGSLTPGGSHRFEIQGLRAVAVGLVLLFHIWPDAVPGGYIGVDVFFVISGYLIVGSLAREAERDGRVSLLKFYSRRARRLLPAASLVLAFAFAGTFLWLPPARWQDTLIQIAASALYSENWYLSWAAVDYLAAENAPSPVQHYWSLSIEEQFYIVWPLVMLAIIAVARVFGAPVRQLLGGALGFIFAGSLVASIWMTAVEPGSAYFVTHTRVWELALGGLLAIWLPRINVKETWRALLFFAGITAILVSSFLFDPAKVPFPSYTALLPTLGAALILLAGDFRVGFFRGLNYPPLRYIGDISYSVYLWHWPLIVFFLATGRTIGLWEGLGLVAVSIAISHVSYHFVEDWFRYPDQPKEYRTLPFGLASILVIVGATAIASTSLGHGAQAGEQTYSVANAYPGPAALMAKAAVPAGVPLRPSPMELLYDKSEVYVSGCHQNQTNSDVNVCEFGDPKGKTSVAVFGSSHAVNWLPTVDVLGKKNGWKVFSVTKSSCSFARKDDKSCNEWQDHAAAYFAEHPVNFVFISEFAGKSISRQGSELIAERWQRIADLGIEIIAIQPTPHLETAPADCVPDHIERCVIPREDAERANSIAFAASTVPGVHVVDMNDAICASDVCSPVVGNMVVFRDMHHLTETYAIALAPYLENAVETAYPGLLPIKGGEFLQNTGSTQKPEAKLTCGAIGGSPAFSRSYAPTIQDGRLSLSSGDWRNEEASFEKWQGTITNDTVSIKGRYIEGGTNIKSIDLVGTAQDGTLIAAGRRGPRLCSLVWTLPDKDP
jgi:peptidoglycan/LPS O-acetylase OafA/YrhL